MFRLRTVLFFGLLLGRGVLAQPEVIFGTGKPPVFKEEDLDRRFAKSKVYRALSQGAPDARCQQIVRGLLTVLADAAPYFHKRDENFYLTPAISQALTAQLNNPRFPGTAYLAAMVRRVMIDGKLPPEWLQTATQLEGARPVDDPHPPIDLAKLRFIADEVRPIDSFLFTLPQLRQQFNLDVQRATTAAGSSAEMEFRDKYLDREVAWGGLTLNDIATERPAPVRRARGSRAAPPEPASLVAHLTWTPPNANRNQLMLFAQRMVEPPIQITARLADPQYLEIDRQPRGTRLLVRGRLWEMDKNATRFEIRDAYLFADPEYPQGAFLADPNAVARCPFAVNDLSGVAPQQPGGFRH